MWNLTPHNRFRQLQDNIFFRKCSFHLPRDLRTIAIWPNKAEEECWIKYQPISLYTQCCITKINIKKYPSCFRYPEKIMYKGHASFLQYKKREVCKMGQLYLVLLWRRGGGGRTSGIHIIYNHRTPGPSCWVLRQVREPALESGTPKLESRMCYSLLA